VTTSNRWMAAAIMVLIALLAWHFVRPQLAGTRDEQRAGIAGDASSEAENEDVARTPVATTNHPPQAERLALPHDYALFPGLSVPAASSWEELLAGLSPEERELAQAFADLYPEAYQFRTREQLEWMVDRGYPMPEEIIAARQMPLDDLLDKAINGNNLKAAMLARDRLLDDILQDMEQAGVPYFENPKQHQLNLARIKGVRRDCSPFSMYLSARQLEMEQVSLTSGATAQSIPIAALPAQHVAHSMGDDRLFGLLQSSVYRLPMDGMQAMGVTSMALTLAATVPSSCPRDKFPLHSR